MTDPVETIREYEERVHDIATRAGSVRAQLATLRPAASSPDGAVTVTVTAAGALADLRFGPAAAGLDLPDLAELVLRTATTARLEAARQAEAAVATLVGPDAAHAAMTTQLPGRDDDTGSAVAGGDEDDLGLPRRAAR